MSDSYFDDKKLEDLQNSVSLTNDEDLGNFTKVKKDECLKYVKWQEGCVGESEGNEEYIGKGDKYICRKVGITQEQLDTFRANLNEAVVALQPAELKVAEL